MNPKSLALALIASLVGLLLPGAVLPAQATFDPSDTLELTVSTSPGSDRFVLPFSAVDGFDVSVDWGDNTASNSSTVNPDHTYATPGTYTIRVTNNGANLLRFGNLTDTLDFTSYSYVSYNQILTAVSQFPTWINSYEEAFSGASSLTSVPASLPAGVVTTTNMFYGASVFNADISGWDTSSVSNMSSMFSRARNFNSDISRWDTSAVTDMSSMFSFASAFNADISGWDTGAVATMESMFEIASSFSSDISSWDTSKVTNFGNMFRSASSFNVNLDAWDTSTVTHMYQMFSGVSAMKYCLPSWKLATRTGTNLTGMFSAEYSNAGCVEAIFDSEGGSTIASYSYKAIYALPAPTSDPTKSDANFLGWASQSGGISISFPVLATIVDPTIDPSASSIVRFYAIWEIALAPAVESPTEQIAIPVAYSGPILEEFSSRSVLPGASVEIRGQRLESINQVSINGLSLEILSSSNTLLLVLIPLGVESGLQSLVLISAFGKLTVMDALTILREELEQAPEAASAKLNAGPMNGSVAVYVKGHAGKMLSWKIAGKWSKLLVTSDYQVFLRKTKDVGRIVQVALYINGEKLLAKAITTR
jgi:surface protein